ncbi:hypothetical protein CSKR_100727, partial [Clonorchis sinensis]
SSHKFPYFDKYTHLKINLVFARDSLGTQLKLSFVMFPGTCMCCIRLLDVPVATIFEMSRYMYIRNAQLIRLLKILPQCTTGSAFLGAHQRLKHETTWCSTFSCLETSHTRDSVGFQVIIL